MRGLAPQIPSFAGVDQILYPSAPRSTRCVAISEDSPSGSIAEPTRGSNATSAPHLFEPCPRRAARVFDATPTCRGMHRTTLRHSRGGTIAWRYEFCAARWPRHSGPEGPVGSDRRRCCWRRRPSPSGGWIRDVRGRSCRESWQGPSTCRLRRWRSPEIRHEARARDASARVRWDCTGVERRRAHRRRCAPVSGRRTPTKQGRPCRCPGGRIAQRGRPLLNSLIADGLMAVVRRASPHTASHWPRSTLPPSPARGPNLPIQPAE